MKVPIFQEGVPRKTGVQGGDAYEHPPAARCSSKESPWRIFGSFLCEQKGTSFLSRPAGRNPASRIEIYDLKENNHG